MFDPQYTHHIAILHLYKHFKVRFNHDYRNYILLNNTIQLSTALLCKVFFMCNANLKMLIPSCYVQAKLYFKELLGEIFVISIIIKVHAGKSHQPSRSKAEADDTYWRPWLSEMTKNWILLDPVLLHNCFEENKDTHSIAWNTVAVWHCWILEIMHCMCNLQISH